MLAAWIAQAVVLLSVTAVAAKAEVLGCPRARDVETLVACVTEQMPRSESGGFVPPSPEAWAAWRATVEAMLAGHCLDIVLPPPLGGAFELRALGEGADPAAQCAIFETADSNSDGFVDRGWGTFVARRSSRFPLHLQVAHPRSDVGTESEAAELFASSGAWSLAIAGAERGANGTHSSCQTGYWEADAAHNSGNLLQATTFATLQHAAGRGERFWVIQFHGLGAQYCRASDVHITPGVDAPPAPGDRWGELAAALRQCHPGWRVTVPGDDPPCDFSGASNVQGRLLNGVPLVDVCSVAALQASGSFIHIEQKACCRTAADWLPAITATWPGDEAAPRVRLRLPRR